MISVEISLNKNRKVKKTCVDYIAVVKTNLINLLEILFLASILK